MTTVPIYLLDADDTLFRDETARGLVVDFLNAHGIDPNRFVVGTKIEVRRHDDGGLWVHTRVAPEGMPVCESCESCVKTRPVVMPLSGPLPAVAWSLLRPADANGVEWAQPADRVAAAESAYRAALETLHRDVRRGSRVASERHEALLNERIMAEQAVSA